MVKKMSKKCKISECPLFLSGKEVPYSGNTNADVIWFGESPGATEEKECKPFVGDAGVLSKRVCRKVGLDWKSLFIMNSARCRIDKSNMADREIRAVLECCRKKVVRAVRAVGPKCIIACGDFALRQLTRRTGITKARGKWIWSEEFNCWIMPTFHPAYILRNRGLLPVLRQDVKAVVSFIKNGYSPPGTEDEKNVRYETVQSIKKLLDANVKSVGFDTETQGLDWMDENFVMISYSVSYAKGVGYQVFLFEECSEDEADFTIRVKRKEKGKRKIVEKPVGVRRCDNFDQKVDELWELLERKSIKKYMMNGNFDVHAIEWLAKKIDRPMPVIRGYTMDVQAAANLIDENVFKKPSLEMLQKMLTDYSSDYNSEFGSKYNKWDMLSVPKEELMKYAVADADVTRRVAVKIKKHLSRDGNRRLANYLVRFTMPTLRSLGLMESNGAWIDMGQLPNVQAEVTEMMEEEIATAMRVVPKKVVEKHKELGLKFTRGDFVRDILFSKDGFGLKPVKQSKTGPSVDKTVRSTLLDGKLPAKARTFLEAYNHWSVLNTLSTRYLNGFRKWVKSDGRIHTKFSLATATTGRVACVTEDAEILTVSGWKKWRELEVGETVIGFDPQRRRLVRTELLDIHTGRGLVGKMVYKHGRTREVGIECTPDHRWVVTNGRVTGFVRACDLGRHGQGGGAFELVLGAGSAANSGWDSDRTTAELIGWGLTDGCVKTTSSGRFYMQIFLKKESSIERFKKTVEGTVRVSETDYRDGRSYFLVGVDEFDWRWRRFLLHDPVEYICNLSRDALIGMWEVMMEADGSTRRYGGGGAYYRFGCPVEPNVNNPYVGDLFMALSILVGQSMIYRRRETRSRKPFMDIEMSSVRRKIPRWIEPFKEAFVWCPETACGTWIVRQGGVVGITGNSSDPNMQNNPKRSKEASKIRRLIAAPKGKVLLAADASQSELRWAAHISRDPAMIKIFRDGKVDIHTATAQALYSGNWDRLDDAKKSSLRRSAKAVNFGLLYGMTVGGFIKYAKMEYGLDLSWDEANSWVMIFFSKYFKLKEYHKNIVEFCRRNGYVESPLGRRRRLPEINSENKWLRLEAERQAINHPIQSISSDATLLAMNAIVEKKPFDITECMPILFVHDENVFESPDDGYVEDRARIIKEFMENPPLEELFGVKPLVPLVAEVKVGYNLAEMEELDL